LMKKAESWEPSKFVPSKSGWKPSGDPKEVSLSSRYVVNIQIKEYEKIIKKYAKGDLLDLGCSSAPLYGVYKDLTTSVTCVDWTKTSHDRKYLDYEMDLNKKLKLKSDQFHTVLLTDVLEHIIEPQNLLGEIKRMLKKNGYLILTVPFFYWVHEAPHDYHRYTRYALEYYCRMSGMRVVELYPYGGAVEVLMDFIAKNIRFSRILSLIHFWVAKLITSSSLSRKLSSKTSERFPLGYILVAKK